jgi:membrane protein required for beta-lactamase induction
MTFIITLISLVIERFFDWSHVRQWHWFMTYQRWLTMHFANWPAYVVLVVCLVPPLCVVGLINHLLSGWLFYLLKLLFGILVLVYCLGPQNFWAQVYQCLNELQSDESSTTIQRVQTVLGLTLPDAAQSGYAPFSQAFHRAFTHALFIEANTRVFAVFFWFILLGPVGAVLYRAVSLCKTQGSVLAAPALQWQRVLDWLPARCFTFIFALGGHFTQVIQHWKQFIFSSPRTNESLITECGVAALDILEENRIPEDGSAEKETLALLDRVFVMGLVILAVIVLVL